MKLFVPATLLLTFGLVGLPGCSKSDESSPAEHSAASASAKATAALAPRVLAKCTPGADGKCEASSACSPKCEQIITQECLDCEALSDCAEFGNSCNDPALSEADRALCYELSVCVQTSKCFEGEASMGACYCGSLSQAECIKAPLAGAGAPNGACRELILKGMPQAKGGDHVLALLTSRLHPTGYALSRLNCLKRGSRSMCAARCGYQVKGAAPFKPVAMPASAEPAAAAVPAK